MYRFHVSVFIILFLVGLLNAEYEITKKFAPQFYFNFMHGCSSTVPKTEVMYIMEYQDFSQQNMLLALILAFGSHPEVMPVIEVHSTATQIMITKQPPTDFDIATPNMLCLTFIGINVTKFHVEGWNLPRLRVLNFIDTQIFEDFDVPSYGSRYLEIIKFKRFAGGQLRFNSTLKQPFLKVLDISRSFPMPIVGICDFILNSKRLIKLVLSGDNPCLFTTLKRMVNYPHLKIVRLYQNPIHIPSGEICSLFPPMIRALRVNWFDADTSVLNCYKKLVSLEVIVSPPLVKHISGVSPSFSVFGDARENRTDVLIRNLHDVKVLRIRNIYSQSNQLPGASKAVMIFFNGNGFSFQADVNAFPDHAKTRLLDLSDNPIEYIPDDAFKSLPLLSVVVLQRTNVSGFADSAFCKLLWPRVVNFGWSAPESLKLMEPDDRKSRESESSLNCLTRNNKRNNIILMSAPCICDLAQYNFLTPSLIQKNFVLERTVCHEDCNTSDSVFYERTCRRKPVAYELEPNVTTYLECEKSEFIGAVVAMWIIYFIICWIPPAALYYIYHRDFWQKLLEEQRNGKPKTLFIICPKHARKWCKRVIIPCLEADLFFNRNPRLRQIRMESLYLASTATHRQANQHGAQAVTNKGILTNPNNVKDHSRKARAPNQELHENSSDMTPTEMRNPSGPWAWQPRFKCEMAPPARHRLTVLMEASQVLIIFPSDSLFTEPACRAQLRLTFHLYRLQRIPPPGIIVWPTTRVKATVANDYRSVNYNRNRLDHDKYYPTLQFNKVTNDPNDAVETAVIKAKVPTKEVAKQLMQFFATRTSPCIEWSNSKTAAANIKPLVWQFNKASRIPAY